MPHRGDEFLIFAPGLARALPIALERLARRPFTVSATDEVTDTAYHAAPTTAWGDLLPYAAYAFDVLYAAADSTLYQVRGKPNIC
ncbi:MAG: hypothetical protein ACLTMP_08165 [Eggerthella lenta]